jgi:hypothetical protein
MKEIVTFFLGISHPFWHDLLEGHIAGIAWGACSVNFWNDFYAMQSEL